MGILDEFLRAIGPGAVVPAVFFFVFAWADQFVSEGFRDWLSGHLNRLRPPGEEATAWKGFLEWFDRIFGTNPLSWRFALRSCVASLLAFVPAGGIWLLFLGGADQLVASSRAEEFGFGFPIWYLTLFLIALPIVLNFIPDYLSLVQTRYLLSLIASRHLPILVALVTDALLTGTIFFLYIGGLATLLEMPWLPFVLIQDLTGGDLDAPGEFSSMIIYFMTTFVTSVWLWVYVVGVFGIRTLARSQRLLNALRFALPIDTKPLRAIGTAAFIPPIIVSGLVAWLVP